jgi:hypothetical protein
MLDLFKKAGAGEVKKSSPSRGRDRQLQRLAIDGEFVLTELDEIAAFGEEFCLIPDLLQCVFSQCLEACAEFISTDAVAKFAKLFDEVAQLCRHDIGGEVGVDFFGFGKGDDAIAQAGENALRRLSECLAAFVAILNEGLPRDWNAV